MSSTKETDQSAERERAHVRLRQLDVLRGIAVLLVIGRHLNYTPDWPQWATVAFGAWIHCGWMGVDLFFVLSGFLVSGLIFREFKRHDSFDLVRFLIRRGFKIYPSFYAFLLLSLGLTGYMHERLTAGALVSEALFVQNYGPNIWPHTWSLAIEEHFYLAIGIILFWLIRTRRSLAMTPWLCLGIMLAAFALRVVTAALPDVPERVRFAGTHLRADGLAFGVLISYLYAFKRERLERWIPPNISLLILGLLLIAPCAIGFVYGWFNYTVGLSLLYLGWGAILYWCLQRKPAKSQRVIALLSSVGLYSYSIYLWHPAVKIIAAVGVKHFTLGAAALPVDIVVYIVGSLMVGTLMSKAVEMPMLAVRDRLFPSRSASQPGG